MNGNPKDPNAPMYQGQALQQQQAPSGGGYHLLEGIGNLVLAGAHFFSGKNDDDEAEEEQPAPRRRVRTFGTRPSGRAGTGSCCRRPTGK